MGTYTTTGTKAVWGYDDKGNRVIVDRIPITTTYTTTSGGNTQITQTNQNTGENIGKTELLRSGSSGGGSITGVSGGVTLEQVKITQPSTEPTPKPDFIDFLQKEQQKNTAMSYYKPTSYKYGPGVGIYNNPFFSVAGQKERLVNVGKTYNSILNPFSNSKAKVTDQVFTNTMTKNLVEKAANNPFITAGVITTGVVYAPGFSAFVGGSVLSYNAVGMSVQAINNSKYLDKYYKVDNRAYKNFRRTDDFVIGKQIYYGTLSQETKGVRGFFSDIVPVSAPTSAKQEAMSNLVKYYQSKGDDYRTAEEKASFINRGQWTSNFVELGEILTINAISNRAGAKLLPYAEKSAKSLRFTGNKFLFRSRVGALTLPGAFEGATTIDVAQTQRYGKAETKDILFGAGLGSISAPLIQYGIDRPVFNLKGSKFYQGYQKSKSNVVKGFAYGTDVFEAPGDILDTISSRSAKFSPIRTYTYTSPVMGKSFSFTPTFTNPFSSSSYSFTKTKNTPITTPSTNVKSNIRSTSNTNVFAFDYLKTNAKSFPITTNPRNDLTTNNMPRTITKVNTNVFDLTKPISNTRSNTNVFDFTNTFTDTRTNVYIPTKAPPIPFLPDGGLFGSKSKGLGFGKQLKKYEPSLYSISFNIKGSNKRTLTGLEVRPI